ncbi:MAG: CopG family transcriptional regulator [Burkholderiales bacterium]
MTATTTLKLSPDLKARVTALAKQTGRTPHSLMIEALERQLDREERMRAFAQEALEADAEIDRTGEIYASEDVHAWLERLAKNRKTKRPKPWQG